MELKASIDPEKTKGDPLGLWLSDFLGSTRFLWVYGGLLVVYLLWNIGDLPGLRPFDAYPFNILSILLSVFAIILTITVLISQKRQRRIEKIREQVEFEINVRAEAEITKMLTMLHDIQQKLGIRNDDPELEEMKESIDVNELHENIGGNADDL